YAAISAKIRERELESARAAIRRRLESIRNGSGFTEAVGFLRDYPDVPEASEIRQLIFERIDDFFIDEKVSPGKKVLKELFTKAPNGTIPLSVTGFTKSDYETAVVSSLQRSFGKIGLRLETSSAETGAFIRVNGVNALDKDIVYGEGLLAPSAEQVIVTISVQMPG